MNQELRDFPSGTGSGSKVFCKKVFLEILQNSAENACSGVYT